MTIEEIYYIAQIVAAIAIVSTNEELVPSSSAECQSAQP